MRIHTNIPLIFLLACVTGLASAQSSGSWTLTGSLHQGRYGANGVTLQNGQVLALGGVYLLRHSKAVLASELYDPTTGNWSVSGNLNVARIHGTATLLPSGKVLAAGGCVDPCTSVEVYDPSTGAWTLTGSMADGRTYHTATLLPNGKVLVAGGCYSACGIYVQSSAELYDPNSGTWSVTGSLSVGRAQHTATLLQNGKVLVAGGISASGSENSSAEIYDPATGKWSSAGNMITGRRFAQAALLTNGRVVVMGGQDTPGNTLSSTELYDPSTNKWSATGKMTSPRLYFVALPFLVSGKVLVAGGANPSVILASSELYDPLTGKWSATGSMNVARIYHFAVILTNGKVLVATGNTGDATAELYQP